jgi:hypothetical protein
MQMSKQKNDEPAGFRVHPNGEIELLSAREIWDIVVRTINAAVARGLGGRRNTEFAKRLNRCAPRPGRRIRRLKTAG